MIPVRLPDWRSRLSALVEGRLQAPFEWGVNDCALFAADAIKAMTGTDPAEGWRGLYCSRRGAVRVIGRAGFEDHVDLAAGLLPSVAPALASLGDVGVIKEPDGFPVFVVIFGALVAAPGDGGLAFVPRAGITQAFHVPFAGEVV